jgi:hypothetical protein
VKTNWVVTIERWGIGLILNWWKFGFSISMVKGQNISLDPPPTLKVGYLGKGLSTNNGIKSTNQQKRSTNEWHNLTSNNPKWRDRDMELLIIQLIVLHTISCIIYYTCTLWEWVVKYPISNGYTWGIKIVSNDFLSSQLSEDFFYVYWYK